MLLWLLSAGVLAAGQAVMVSAARVGRTDGARRLWWWGAVPTWLLAAAVTILAGLAVFAWLFLGIVSGALFLAPDEYSASWGAELGGTEALLGAAVLGVLTLSTVPVSVRTRRAVRPPRPPAPDRHPASSSTIPPPPPPPPM